jgi:hypothetical protein
MEAINRVTRLATNCSESSALADLSTYRCSYLYVGAGNCLLVSCGIYTRTLESYMCVRKWKKCKPKKGQWQQHSH